MATAAAAAVVLVVARARNGVIGAGGALPWRLKSDMAHFKAVTSGKPVVMGRKTWASLKRALPGRDNIVISRDSAFRAAGGWSFSSLEAALACAGAQAAQRRLDEVCVIGGAEIYAAALPLAQRIYVTDVQADVAGDTVFPTLSVREWRETAAREAPAGDGDDHAMIFRTLERMP